MKNILILAIVFGAFLHAKPTLTPEVKALLVDAKSKVEGVSASTLQEMISKKSVVLLDVRDPNEWEKGTITTDKLVKISRGFLEVKYPKLILKNYKKTDTFVVYCALEPRSIFASARLEELGFSNVKYLKGGFKNWSKNKLPISK